MEEKNPNSGSLEDVNVYITLDSSDFEMMKAKQAKRKQPAGSKFTDVFSDALEDLNLCLNLKFVGSVRGVLLLAEMIFSIILIIVTATNWSLHEGRAVGIVMNSITLTAGLVHLVAIVTRLIEYLPSQAIIVSLQLLKNVILLLLQFTAYIVYVSCGRDSAPAVVFTLILCCVMILSVLHTSMEYNPTDGNKTKQYKKNRHKGTSYKRLRRY